MLSGILAKGASYLGRLRLLLKLIDRSSLPHRLTVHGILEPFDHRLEVLESFLDDIEAVCHRVL